MLKNLLLFGLTLTLMVGVMFATLSCSDDNLKTQLSIDTLNPQVPNLLF